MAVVSELIQIFLVGVGLGVLLLTFTPFLQAAAVTFLPERSLEPIGMRRRTAVIIPAHNEASGIGRVLEQIHPQLQPGEQILVIAHNCSDNTAEVASTAGATVLVVNDPGRGGKGFALQAAYKYLAKDPPKIVIFVDADCVFTKGGVNDLSIVCAELDRPVQCRNLMVSGGGLKEFAWRIKNELRPSGSARLNLPCQLSGTGMALPWRLLGPALVAPNHLAEDVAIGLRCAQLGAPPQFLAGVTVESNFPPTVAGQSEQKQRWVHGHLQIIREIIAQRMIRQCCGTPSIARLALVADAVTPPLSLLGGLNLAFLLLAFAFWAVSGHSVPLALGVLAAGMLASLIVIAIIRFGNPFRSYRELLGITLHAWIVLKIAGRYFKGNKTEWRRAERRPLSLNTQDTDGPTSL